MKNRIIALAAIALAATLALSGCFPRFVDRDIETEPPTSAAAGATEDSIEPAPEPPIYEVGTLKNPAPAGTTITADNYDGTTFDIAFVGVNGAANEYVATSNQFNDAAPAGFHWVVITVTVTNTSADAAKAVAPGVAVYDLTLVDEATGQSFSQEFASLGNLISGQNDIYAGQSATGEQAYLVPDSAVTLLAASGGVFIRL